VTLRFEVLGRQGRARLGRLTTAHGEVPTPAFMPVGTLGAVKGMEPGDLRRLGADIMLSNLYHLAVHPGIERVESLGGVHEFTGWRGPILTDSGGYQVFSLASLREIDTGGVTFRSHHDGSTMRFTPESVVSMQERIGVDLAMVLDECPPWPVEREQAAEALERTNLWARRSRESWSGRSALFGIVQGSFFPDLRDRAVEELVPLDFAGYAIGGVSVGEAKGLGRDVIARVAPQLPDERPRYLMGLGRPSDIAYAVQQGIDLFDCVLPTRNGRHGNLFTRRGIVKIKNARYRDDPRPLDPDAPRAEGGVSRAFLHHLFRSGEITGQVIASRHNLRFYLDFMARLRQALTSGTLADLAAETQRWESVEREPEAS
jgi:queuine tRNA-ribosyltransferase